MVAVRGAFSSLIAPGLRKVVMTSLAQYPEEFSKIFNVDTSKRKYEDDRTVAGLGITPEKGEGEPTQYNDPAEGYQTRYTHKSYGLGYRVTQEMYDDDLYQVMGTKMSKQLSRSMKNKYETTAFAIFNGAFTASKTDGDALALCSTAHTLVKGGTTSNRLATDSDLSVTSLRSATALFERAVDDDNMLIQQIPKILLVPTEEKYTAREILKSEWRPDGTTNAINGFLDDDLQYMVGHYLTDTDAWFLLARKEDTELHFFWRVKPNFTNGDDFDTGDAKFKSYARWSQGWSDFRGVVGTPGA